MKFPSSSSNSRVKYEGGCYWFYRTEHRMTGVLLSLFSGSFLIANVVFGFEAGETGLAWIPDLLFSLIILPLFLVGVYFVASHPRTAILDVTNQTLYKAHWLTGRPVRKCQTRSLFLWVQNTWQGDDASPPGSYIGALDVPGNPEFEVEFWSQPEGGREHVGPILVQLQEIANWRGVAGDLVDA